MLSRCRRRFLRALSAPATVLAAGCSALSDGPSPEPTPPAKPIRVLDPVRTEGPPFRVRRP